MQGQVILEKKERNSSLELLRIVCMLLIIMHHYSVHGGFGTFTVEMLEPGTVFVQLLSLFGRPACSVFVLISGFFLVQKDAKKHYRKIVPLVAEMTFYSVLIWALFVLTRKIPFSTMDAVTAAFPLFWGSWFLVYYVILYMLVPLINPMLLALSRKAYRRLLLAVYTIWSLVPTFAFSAWPFGNLDFFLVMYLTGAYIRLHVHGKTKYDNRWNLAVALGLAAVMILSVVGFDILGFLFHSDKIVKHATYLKEYNMIPAVGFAVALFLYFSNLEFHSRTINLIASSMMGIYLIHDNGLMKTVIWMELWPNIHYLATPYIHAAVKVAAVFCVCLLIDLLRRATVGKWFDRWFYRHCDAICDWVAGKIPQPIKQWMTGEQIRRGG